MAKRQGGCQRVARRPYVAKRQGGGHRVAKQQEEWSSSREVAIEWPNSIDRVAKHHGGGQ